MCACTKREIRDKKKKKLCEKERMCKKEKCKERENERLGWLFGRGLNDCIVLIMHHYPTLQVF
jgi:hypothetical protein